MTEIALIGGHGKVALQAAPLLVQAGYGVHSVIRNPDHIADIEATGAHPVIADIERLDVARIENILLGRRIVIWSAGAGGGDPKRTYAVDRDAAIHTIDAAIRIGVRRFISVSYFGAGPDHGVDPGNSFYAYAEAKTAADTHLALSPLAWTILRPSRLTDDEPTGRIAVGPDQEPGSVSRGNVARTILAAVTNDQTIGKILEYNDGDVPIEEAFRARR